MTPQAFYSQDTSELYPPQCYQFHHQRDYNSPESSLPTPTSPYDEHRYIYAPQPIGQHIFQADYANYSSEPLIRHPGISAVSAVSPIITRQSFQHDDDKALSTQPNEIAQLLDAPSPDAASLPTSQIGERINEDGISDTLAFDGFNKLHFGPHTTSPTNLKSRRRHARGPEKSDNSGGDSGLERDLDSRSSFAGNKNLTPCHPSSSHTLALPRELSPSRERRPSHAMLFGPPWEPPRRHPHPIIAIPNGPHYHPYLPSRQLHARSHSYPYASSTYLAPQPSPQPSSSHPEPYSAPAHALTEIYSISNEELDRYFTHSDGDNLFYGRSGGRRCWRCPECKKNVRKQDRASHSLAHEGKKRYHCRCGKKFGRPQDADRHLREQAPCQRCAGKMGRYGKGKHCSACVSEIEVGGSLTR